LLRRGSPSCGAPSQFIALASQYMRLLVPLYT
jgi:hypothetical protein